MPPVGKHVREAMADDLPRRVGLCDLDGLAALGTDTPHAAGQVGDVENAIGLFPARTA